MLIKRKKNCIKEYY